MAIATAFDSSRRFPLIQSLIRMLPGVPEHPVVRVRPVTRRKLLFVDRGFTARIVQQSQSESDALLAFLFQHLDRPKLFCRSKEHRVKLCGDKPFASSSSIQG